MSINAKDLGEKIRIARVTLGITQQELADAINVRRPYISALERGARTPSLNVISLLSEVLPELVIGADPPGQHADDVTQMILKSLSEMTEVEKLEVLLMIRKAQAAKQEGGGQ